MKNINLVALAFLLIIAPPIMAEDHPPRKELPEFIKNDPQLYQLMKDKHKFMEEAMEDMFKERKKLGELLKNPASSEAEIRQQAKIINDKMIAINNRRTEDILALRKDLPADKFQKLIEQFEQKREQMKEKLKERFAGKAGRPKPHDL